MTEPENESKENLEKQAEEKEENLEKLPSEIEELLPPQLRKVIQASLSMQRVSTPFLSPIQEKINEQHIAKILEIVEKDDERAFLDVQSARRYSLIIIIVSLSFFGSLTVFLVNKDVAVYQEILKILIIFGGGFGSGIGFKGYLDKKNK